MDRCDMFLSIASYTVRPKRRQNFARTPVASPTKAPTCGKVSARSLSTPRHRATDFTTDIAAAPEDNTTPYQACNVA